MDTSLSLELQTAIKAAKAGAETVLHYYHEGITYEHKEDKSILTTADVEAEEVIKTTIQEVYPEAIFLAEESGGDLTSPTMWIIDPIDSTRSFSRGIPTWDILIGYKEAEEMKIGVSYFPVLNVLVYAEKGKGAFINGKQINVSSLSTLSQSLIGLGSPGRFTKPEVLLDLIKASESVRSPDPVYTASLIAKGSMDGLVDAYGKPWDFAPYKVIIEESGGKITKLNGDTWKIDDSKGCVISNGLIHDELIDITKKYY